MPFGDTGQIRSYTWTICTMVTMLGYNKTGHTMAGNVDVDVLIEHLAPLLLQDIRFWTPELWHMI